MILLARSDNAEQLPLSTVNPGDSQGIGALDLEPVDHPDAGE